jgi:hypothetical protein
VCLVALRRFVRPLREALLPLLEPLLEALLRGLLHSAAAVRAEAAVTLAAVLAGHPQVCSGRGGKHLLRLWACYGLFRMLEQIVAKATKAFWGGKQCFIKLHCHWSVKWRLPTTINRVSPDLFTGGY